MYTLLKWSCFLFGCGIFGLYLASRQPIDASPIGPQLMILALVILSFQAVSPPCSRGLAGAQEKTPHRRRIPSSLIQPQLPRSKKESGVFETPPLCYVILVYRQCPSTRTQPSWRCSQ